MQSEKIYPLTKEQMDQEEDWVIEALEELQQERQTGEPDKD